jgi:hypothetical protein
MKNFIFDFTLLISKQIVDPIEHNEKSSDEEYVDQLEEE